MRMLVNLARVVYVVLSGEVARRALIYDSTRAGQVDLRFENSFAASQTTLFPTSLFFL